jgi:hypothetical protein
MVVTIGSLRQGYVYLTDQGIIGPSLPYRQVQNEM